MVILSAIMQKSHIQHEEEEIATSKYGARKLHQLRPDADLKSLFQCEPKARQATISKQKSGRNNPLCRIYFVKGGPKYGAMP